MKKVVLFLILSLLLVSSVSAVWPFSIDRDYVFVDKTETRVISSGGGGSGGGSNIPFDQIYLRLDGTNITPLTGSFFLNGSLNVSGGYYGNVSQTYGYSYNNLEDTPGLNETSCNGTTCTIFNLGTLDGYEAADLLDNTDSQTLSYDAGTDVISITNGNSIDISEVDTVLNESTVDGYADNNNYVDFDDYPYVDTDYRDDINGSYTNDTYVNVDGDVMSGDLNFTNASINDVNYVQFNTSYTDGVAEGRLQWNSEDGTLEVGMPGGDVNLQIGQEMFLPRPKNVETFDMPNCRAVWLSGATGGVGEIELASANETNEARGTIALTTETIASNQRGYATTTGIVRDCDLSAFNDGDALFLGLNGTLKRPPITSGNDSVFIGVVLRAHATEGELFVKIIRSPNFEELSNVFGTPSNRSIAQFDSDTNTFMFTSQPTFDNITVLETSDLEDVTVDGDISSTDGFVDFSSYLRFTDGSTLRIGAPDPFVSYGNATVISSNRENVGGARDFAIINTALNLTLMSLQTGVPFGAGYFRNSYIFGEDFGSTNSSETGFCNEYVNMFNDRLNKSVPLRVDCSSNAYTGTGTGGDLIVEDDIQLLDGKIIAEQGAELRNSFVFDGNGLRADFDIIDSDMHIRNSRLANVTFGAGENSDVEDFNTGFGTYNSTTWADNVNDVDYCNSDELCVDASAGTESISRSYDFTDDINITVEFYVGYQGLDAANDDFYLQITNGTFTQEIWNVTLVGANNDQSSTSVGILNVSSSLWNQSNITFVFTCVSGNPSEICYLDDVNVTKYDASTSIEERIELDGVIKFGDETCEIVQTGTTGNQTLDLRCPTVLINGAEINGTGSGGNGTTDHSLLNNLEFTDSGHTFIQTGQTLDIGSYDFVTTENVTADNVFDSVGNLRTGITDNTNAINDVNATFNNSRYFSPIIGVTASSYDGNITNGSLIGYNAANAICEAEYGDGAHFCLKSEVLRAITNNQTSFSGTNWFQNGPPGYTANADDCSGWTTDDNTYLGPFWNWDANSQAGVGRLTNCAQSKQLLCCG